MTMARAGYEERPWGGFVVLDEADGYKVKRLDVLPGRRLSYQKHRYRTEDWVVLQGNARITRDGREAWLGPGHMVHIAVQVAHRVENCGPELLVLIEVQRGSYFGEDDILRLEDDFGRAASTNGRHRDRPAITGPRPARIDGV